MVSRPFCEPILIQSCPSLFSTDNPDRNCGPVDNSRMRDRNHRPSGRPRNHEFKRARRGWLVSDSVSRAPTWSLIQQVKQWRISSEKRGQIAMRDGWPPTRFTPACRQRWSRPVGQGCNENRTPSGCGLLRDMTIRQRCTIAIRACRRLPYQGRYFPCRERFKRANVFLLADTAMAVFAI